jgi:hypothetical protein
MTMTTQEIPSTDVRLEWEAPERPQWVQRINDEGDVIEAGAGHGAAGIKQIVPLDEDSLLSAATDATGLSDFGADDWREPFRVFITALEQEAALNLLGRIRTRSEILQLLCARLQIEDTYKRHPEIADEQITQPLIIIGQGRSGTSLLQNVLGHHPDNGVLMHWEMVFPCPPPERATYDTDPRIEKADALIDQWNRVTPTMPSMHELRGYMPFEDCILMAMNFGAISWMDCLGQVPSYDAYIMQQDIEPHLRYHERVLKLLQWKNPRRHWVLKDPMHLDRIPALLNVYPDACFVWPHRDPVRALASLVSIIGTIQWSRSEEPFRGVSLDLLMNPEISAYRFQNVIDQIESGAIPPRQIVNVLYRDLVGDTIATVERIYEHFGIELTAEGRQAMVQYMLDNPRDNRPAHRFSIGSGPAVERARAALAPYQEHFGVPSE